MSRWPVRLYNGVQRARWKLGGAPVGFRDGEDAHLEAARSATGLDDFGDPGFREGLGVLLRAYDEEARLTPFGRRMVSAELTGILAARLTVEAAWKREPRVLDEPIRRPIFVLGLPRTGTTALHSLLAQDPEHQVLEYWLATAPGPRPPRSAWQRDPRFVAARRGLRTLYFLDPGLKSIHLLTPEGPDECRHLFVQSFVDHTFDSNAHIPSYTRWFASQDMRPAYARHRDVLKLIGSPTPERRWVLKYPAHLRELPALLETYPDACIVQTHRDPARVLPSLCSLVAGWRSLYEDPVDARALGRWQLDMLSDMVVGAVATRSAADPSCFYDFHFDDVLSDPVGGVKRMYKHFGLELTAEAERRMRAWHAQHPQGAHGGHGYTSAQFGLSDGEIRERFGPYIERHGVASEAGT